MFNTQFQKLMVQGALLKNSVKAKAQSPLMNLSKRQFSSTGALSGSQKAAIGMTSLGLFGLTYLNYQAHMQYKHAPRVQQMSHFNPVVQQRISNTFGYFTYACGATGMMTYMLRNNYRILNMGFGASLGLFALSIGTMFGTHMMDYNNNWMMKNLMYTAFIGTMSTSLVPLIHMYAGPVVFDALIATGFTVGALGTVAYNAPSEQFLSWGGPLALGCGGLIGISLLQMIYPHSSALYNLWLYGGLALFSAYLMYDTQKIISNAKTHRIYDPINNSIGVYLDAFNLFVRFMMIFGNQRKK